MKYFFSELRIYICNFIIAFIPLHFVRLFYYKHVMRFKIGQGSSIHLGCHFNCAGKFEMGENSTINQYCHIDNRGGITIGTNVSISPKASLISADHDVNDEHCAGREGHIIVEDFVFIGFEAKVFRNCNLAYGSVVGAASLLTKSTEAYGIYYGIPAKLMSYRNKTFNYSGSYKRLFH